MAVSFDFKKRLGSGYFGEVWYAIDTGLGCEIAIKCIPKDKLINKKNFYQEAQVLKASEHPNIIKVNDTGELKDGRIYVSMEYLKIGSLEDEAKGAFVPLSRAKRIMIDVLRGLAHAHSKNIVHRDIKPANILIGDASEGKLSDFGLALPDIGHVNLSYLKKYQYILHLAPEVKKLKDYTHLSDIYSCGITFYRLINGDSFLPQIDLADAPYLASLGKFPAREKYRDFIPASLKRLINKAMNVDPSARFQSADEMRHAIEQQLFYVDWNETLLQNGCIWEGICRKGLLYTVKKHERKDGMWEIETKRGKSKNSLRKISDKCLSGIKKQEADRLTKKILQDYVKGIA